MMGIELELKAVISKVILCSTLSAISLLLKFLDSFNDYKVLVNSAIFTSTSFSTSWEKMQFCQL